MYINTLRLSAFKFFTVNCNISFRFASDRLAFKKIYEMWNRPTHTHTDIVGDVLSSHVCM